MVALVLVVLVMRAIDLTRRLEDFDKKVLAGEKSVEYASYQEDGEYNFTLPVGISATEEIKARFGQLDARRPIASLLIRAGYGDLVYGDMWDVDGVTQEEWARTHTEEWKRYVFQRWGDLRQEISSEIKKRVGDELEMKKYICGLITPFQDLSRFDYAKGDFKECRQAEALLISYANCYSYTSDEYIALWNNMLTQMEEDGDDKDYTVPEYDQMMNKWVFAHEENYVYKENPEATAFETMIMFPQNYSALIAGCLMENGVQTEYMDYQDMCGFKLVEKVYASDVAEIMNWTVTLVSTYQPRRVIYIGRSEVANGELTGDPDVDYVEYSGSEYNDRLKEIVESVTKEVISRAKIQKSIDAPDTTVQVSFGDISELPPEFQTRKAAEIWEKAYKNGIIDEHFKFIGSQIERALFAGNLSTALFGRIDWVTIRKWDDYEYFAQKYGLVSKRSRSGMSERGKLIYDLFK